MGTTDLKTLSLESLQEFVDESRRHMILSGNGIGFDRSPKQLVENLLKENGLMAEGETLNLQKLPENLPAGLNVQALVNGFENVLSRVHTDKEIAQNATEWGNVGPTANKVLVSDVVEVLKQAGIEVDNPAMLIKPETALEIFTQKITYHLNTIEPVLDGNNILLNEKQVNMACNSVAAICQDFESKYGLNTTKLASDIVNELKNPNGPSTTEFGMSFKQIAFNGFTFHGSEADRFSPEEVSSLLNISIGDPDTHDNTGLVAQVGEHQISSALNNDLLNQVKKDIIPEKNETLSASLPKGPG